MVDKGAQRYDARTSEHRVIIGEVMRTTIDIEDDVLQAAKEIAQRERTSAGRDVSRLLRAALTQPATPQEEPSMRDVSGFRPFASTSARIVTNERVEQLRDEEGT